MTSHSDILKRCRELGVKTTGSNGVRLPWKTLLQKCLVHDLPDPKELLPSTSLEELIVKKDKKTGEHYWSPMRHKGRIPDAPSHLLDHPMLRDYQPVKPDTRIPISIAIEIYNDYLDADAEPDFLNSPLIANGMVPFGVLMGEDVI